MAELDALRSYEFRRFFMDERKEKQKTILDLENREINLLDNKSIKNDWLKILNFKKKIHELEENQFNIDIRKSKIQMRQKRDEQMLEKAIKRLNDKFKDIEYNEYLFKDIESNNKEEEQKLKEKQMKMNIEHTIRKNLIEEKRKDKRLRILNEMKQKNEFSNSSPSFIHKKIFLNILSLMFLFAYINNFLFYN